MMPRRMYLAISLFALAACDSLGIQSTVIAQSDPVRVIMSVCGGRSHWDTVTYQELLSGGPSRTATYVVGVRPPSVDGYTDFDRASYSLGERTNEFYCAASLGDCQARFEAAYCPVERGPSNPVVAGAPVGPGDYVPPDDDWDDDYVPPDDDWDDDYVPPPPIDDARLE